MTRLPDDVFENVEVSPKDGCDCLLGRYSEALKNVGFVVEAGELSELVSRVFRKGSGLILLEYPKLLLQLLNTHIEALKAISELNDRTPIIHKLAKQGFDIIQEYLKNYPEKQAEILSVFNIDSFSVPGLMESRDFPYKEVVDVAFSSLKTNDDDLVLIFDELCKLLSKEYN